MHIKYQELKINTCRAREAFTWGAKIYDSVPKIAPPRRKPATKSPPPLLLSLHIKYKM